MTLFPQHFTGAARRAVTLGFLAILAFILPLAWVLVFRFYGEGLGVFWVLYLILAIPATVASAVASRRGEWGHPDGGKRFLLALYGVPFIIVLLLAAWFLKR